MQISRFVFLLIFWNSSSFASENRTPNHLQFWLGCQALIPCQHSSTDSYSFKWFYQKDERSKTIKIFSQDKKGLDLHQPGLRDRMRVLSNRSLVIDNLREDDQGLYRCENCIQENCGNEQSTVTNVTKEIPKEKDIYKTEYVTEGSSFTHACPGGFTNFIWTFEASKMTALRNSAQTPESYFTSNKSIHIVNVKRADAGKYTCWTNRCKGHRQKLLTINLCVVTAHHSGDCCSVMCDETDKKHVVPCSFLNCSTKQMSDGYSAVNSTHRPSNASNKTTGIPTEADHPILIYGTSAALVFLVLIALLICYLRPRLRAVSPTDICCCGLNGRAEEETSVVYSSIIIRTPARTTYNHMANNNCVYSEIKV